MRTITVQERQTILDIALQYCGDVQSVFEIIELNDFSITEELKTGQAVVVTDTYNKKITEFYSTNSIKPATAYIETVSDSNAMRTNDNNHDLITNDNNDLIIEN
ncbi:MAG: hypothetical protein LBG80_09850 [Bacteroidales bacterium]|jgi:hypothetical protein|nr:hypothetical protein [Bacteroidales bacterium]